MILLRLVTIVCTLTDVLPFAIETVSPVGGQQKFSEVHSNVRRTCCRSTLKGQGARRLLIRAGGK